MAVTRSSDRFRTLADNLVLVGRRKHEPLFRGMRDLWEGRHGEDSPTYLDYGSTCSVSKVGGAFLSAGSRYVDTQAH